MHFPSFDEPNFNTLRDGITYGPQQYRTLIYSKVSKKNTHFLSSALNAITNIKVNRILQCAFLKCGRLPFGRRGFQSNMRPTHTHTHTHSPQVGVTLLGTYPELLENTTSASIRIHKLLAGQVWVVFVWFRGVSKRLAKTYLYKEYNPTNMFDLLFPSVCCASMSDKRSWFLLGGNKYSAALLVWVFRFLVVMCGLFMEQHF